MENSDDEQNISDLDKLNNTFDISDHIKDDISEKEKMEEIFDISDHSKHDSEKEINVVILPKNATPMRIQNMLERPKIKTPMRIQEMDQEIKIQILPKNATPLKVQNMEEEIKVIILPKNATPMKEQKMEQENDKNGTNISNVHKLENNFNTRLNLKKETSMEIEKPKEKIEPLQDLTKDLKPKPKKVTSHIYKDFFCTLNQTDISYNERGHNKFYKIFLIQRGNRFIVRTEHGRVGAQAQVNVYEKTFQEAVKFFKKKFRDKTQNSWDQRDQFRQVAGKYTYLPMSIEQTGFSGTINQEIKKINQRNKLLMQQIQTIKSNLPQPINGFMKFIWNLEKMKKTLYDLHFDTSKNPLGKLSMSQFQRGFQILTELQNVIKSDKRNKKQRITHLTNQFYTFIPQDVGMRGISAIDTVQALKEKTRFLEILKEIHLTDNMINDLVQQKSDIVMNPLDKFYDLLKIKITTVKNDTKIYQIINQAIQNTHGPTHQRYTLQIENIFEVNRVGEKKRYYPFKQLPNKMLLWHGSRSTNFVGILQQGLRIAPPEAPVTGYMFGKGIYFTDVASKSANYCHATRNHPSGILILCEVALGEQFEIGDAKSFKRPPKYFHSVKAVGKYIPKADQIYENEDNAKLMIGKIFRNERVEKEEFKTKLNYNEYVVYDVA